MHPKPVPLTPRVSRLQSHRFSPNNKRTMQADLCCSRAPQAVLQVAPLDCSSGTHCSAAWSMASAGCLPPLSDRQDRPGKATRQRTPKTNSNKKNEFRYNAAPGRGQKQSRGARTGVPWGAKRLQSLVTLASATFPLPLIQHPLTKPSQKQPDTQREGPAQTLGQDTTRDQPQGREVTRDRGGSQQQPRKGQTQRSPTTPREAHKGQRKRHPQKRRQKHKHNKKHHKQEPGTRERDTKPRTNRRQGKHGPNHEHANKRPNHKRGGQEGTGPKKAQKDPTTQ